MARTRLKWKDPAQQRKAAEALAKDFNKMMDRYDVDIATDFMNGLRQGLGYMKKDGKNDYNDAIFDRIFKLDASGKLVVKDTKKAQEVFEAFASKKDKKVEVLDPKTKEVIKVKSIADQPLRKVYENTPSLRDYEKRIRKDILKGYTEEEVRYGEYIKDTIKATAEALKENVAVYQNKSDAELKIEAKALMASMSKAIENEMLRRALYDKENPSDITSLYRQVSEAIRNDLLSAENAAQAYDLVHHYGATSTYGDINMLQSYVGMIE